jgi:hypothetical protein
MNNPSRPAAFPGGISIYHFEPHAEGTLRGLASALFAADGILVHAIELHSDGTRRWITFPEIIGFTDDDTARQYMNSTLTAIEDYLSDHTPPEAA